MAKNLSFTLGGAEYAAAPVKIERKKLYGWSEVIALDDDGKECSVVTVDETGAAAVLDQAAYIAGLRCGDRAA